MILNKKGYFANLIEYFRGFVRLSMTVMAVFILCSTAIFASAEEKDLDKDGIITYKDLTQSARYELTRGYTAGLRNQNFGFEMIYNFSNRYVIDVGLPWLNAGNKRYNNSYSNIAWKIKQYYRHERYNYEKYPRDTNRWFAVSSWKDKDLGWVAVVNCTTPHSKLVTPETIYHDGHKCTVIGISLTNAYLSKLTITDNITRIEKCECPELKELSGGLNVEYIGNEAFKDCIYLTNMPYFPYLTHIGSFAFEGCVNLTEVLLPPGISFMTFDSFGWYDVVKGNYDIQEGYQFDDDLLGADRYADKYKIFGITLYATKGTTTWESLQDLFENRDKDSVALDNISYASKDKYPGVQPPVEIEEDEYEEWVPYYVDYDDDWTTVEVVEPVDLKDPKSAANSVSQDKKEVLDWIAGMLFSGEIDDDMAVTLICAMTGYADIPKDFLDKHLHDAQCAALVEMYTKAAERVLEMQRLKEKAKNKEAAELDAKRANNRNLALSYLCTAVSTTSDYLKGKGVKVPPEYSKGLGYAATLNDMLNYVASGDTWSGAARKTLTTTVYSSAVAKFAPSPVGIFETVVFVTFGNSKAGDAASIVGTGKHYVEFMTDLLANSFYDAWLNSLEFADNVRWRAFYSIYYQNIKSVLKDVTDTKNYKYGQNLTNYAFMLETLLVPENFIYTFNGLVEMFTAGNAYSSFSNSVYDVTVKNNFLGETLYDFVASFYEEAPDILTEYTKTMDTRLRGKKR